MTWSRLFSYNCTSWGAITRMSRCSFYPFRVMFSVMEHPHMLVPVLADVPAVGDSRCFTLYSLRGNKTVGTCSRLSQSAESGDSFHKEFLNIWPSIMVIISHLHRDLKYCRTLNIKSSRNWTFFTFLVLNVLKKKKSHLFDFILFIFVVYFQLIFGVDFWTSLHISSPKASPRHVDDYFLLFL